MKKLCFKPSYFLYIALMLSNFLTVAYAEEPIEKAQTALIEMSELYVETLKNWSAVQLQNQQLKSEDFYEKFITTKLLDFENVKGSSQIKLINGKILIHLYHRETKAHFLIGRAGEIDFESSEIKSFLANAYYKMGESRKKQKFYTYLVDDWMDLTDSFNHVNIESIKTPEGWKRLWIYFKYRPTFPDKKLAIFRIAVSSGMIFALGESLRYVGFSGPDLLDSFLGITALYFKGRLIGPALSQFQEMGTQWERHMKGLLVGLSSSIVFATTMGSLASLNPLHIQGLVKSIFMAFMNYIGSLTEKSFERATILKNAATNQKESLLEKIKINSTQLKIYTGSIPGDATFLVSVFLSKSFLGQSIPVIGPSMMLMNHLFINWYIYRSAKKMDQKLQTPESKIAFEKAKRNWNFLLETQISEYLKSSDSDRDLKKELSDSLNLDRAASPVLLRCEGIFN